MRWGGSPVASAHPLPLGESMFSLLSVRNPPSHFFLETGIASFSLFFGTRIQGAEPTQSGVARERPTQVGVGRSMRGAGSDGFIDP